MDLLSKIFDGAETYSSGNELPLITGKGNRFAHGFVLDVPEHEDPLSPRSFDHQ